MFSVVIPAYNCEKTIERVLDSVISQTRVDLVDEVIIVNDGSTDNTQRIVNEYINNHNSIKFVYIYQNNSGASVARNNGIMKAQSEWIALLDSDDLWFNNKLERQYEEIQKNPKILFLGSHYPVRFLFKEYKKGLIKLSANNLCIRSMPTTPSVVFHKETGIELGLFNEEMQYCEDINFFQKFLLKDSYYILAEKLVNISIEKKFTGQSGVSSNLKKMAKGRDKNTRELYEMNLISWPFFAAMMIMNKMKYIKRITQRKVSILINR